MSVLKKVKHKLGHFGQEEDGQIAIMMAVSSLAILSVVGAAMDFTTLTNADAKAQTIADSVALTAAIYVKNNGVAPTSKDEGPFGVYTASELGYDMPSYVKNGNSGVTVTVNYDDEIGESTVTVKGETQPIFSQVMGYDTIKFEAVAVVKYQKTEFSDPASIALILDNSGSMAWDDKEIEFNSNGTHYTPSDAIPRIDALKTSVIGFMDKLDSQVGNQTNGADGDRILRTGMLAYNSDTISTRTVNMKWGTLSNGNINSMQANGGTNSSPAMKTVRQWMSNEDAVHKTENGKTPLKFAIFMTDGVNTSGGIRFTPKSGTGIWGYESCSHNNCSWYTYNQSQYPNFPFASYGYIEGVSELIADIDTLADCLALKNSGVKVYTIGFALEEGVYEANSYWQGNMQYTSINEETSESAYAFLQGCASKPAHFIKAENAKSLEQAFEVIGTDIISDLVRISG